MAPPSPSGVYDFRKLKTANQAAQNRAQGLGPGQLVLACGRVVEQTPGKVPKAPSNERNSWTLRVVVVSEGGGWPNMPVNVVATESGNAFGNGNVTFPSVQSLHTSFNNNGRHLLQVRVNHPGWSQATRSVSIDDGDDKLLVLRIMREPWIAFRVFDVKANDYVLGVPLNLDIPGAGGPHVSNSLQLFPLTFENLPLNPATASIVDIGAQDNAAVWVAVDFRQV